MSNSVTRQSGLYIPLPPFRSKLVESVRMISMCCLTATLDAIQNRTRVIASTSICQTGDCDLTAGTVVVDSGPNQTQPELIFGD